MSRLNRFTLSVESLETRETPSSLSAEPPVPSESFYGTGVYKTVDGGQTGTASGPSDASNQGWGKWEVNPDESSAVRHRMFAIVDRTQLGGNDSIWIDIEAPVQTASGDSYGGSHALYQDIVIPAATGTADKDMAMKGSKIGENAPAGATGTFTLTFNGQTVAQTGNVYTVTFGGSLVG